MNLSTNQRLVLLSAILLSAWVSLGAFVYMSTRSSSPVLGISTQANFER